MPLVKLVKVIGGYEKYSHLILVGLPEAVTDVLRVAGVPGAGPHGVSGHHGAAGLPVHSVVDIGGTHGPRWEPELLHRYTRWHTENRGNCV